MNILQLTSGDYSDFGNVGLLQRVEPFDTDELQRLYDEFKEEHKKRADAYHDGMQKVREAAAGGPCPDIRRDPGGWRAWSDRSHAAACAYTSENPFQFSAESAFVEEVLIGQLGFERVAYDTLHLP